MQIRQRMTRDVSMTFAGAPAWEVMHGPSF